MESLNTGILKNLPLVLPAKNEQARITVRIHTETRKVIEAIGAIEREMALVRDYRTRLIADVVTGKLDVREAAANLPDEPYDFEPIDEADSLIDDTDAVEGEPETLPEEVEV